MKINEEQNCLNKATFNHETTLLQIAWKTIWSMVHLEGGANTMRASTAFAPQKQNKLTFDCTFQCHSFKKNIARDLGHD